MHVLADENIPLVREAFAAFGTVETRPGRAMTPEAVRGADVLLVRSVTRVDEALLGTSAVRFVGTATIGTDHLDVGALRRRGIAVASAPGSNAESVVEWVLAALLRTAAARGEALAGRTVGVVGVGQVGGRLAPRLEALGMTVLRCDPPRAEAEGTGHGATAFVPLAQVLDASDIVTLHTPLTVGGAHPTAHLVGARELARLRPGAWLVNASRGAVVDGAALLAALRSGHLGAALLDVFEHEPAPDPALVAAATLATPHIAGYSFDGKLNGARRLFEALAEWSGQAAAFDWDAAYALTPEDERPALDAPASGMDAVAETAALDARVRRLYDIAADDARFRATLALSTEADRAEAFARLRKTYPRRRAWGHYGAGVP